MYVFSAKRHRRQDAIWDFMAARREADLEVERKRLEQEDRRMAMSERKQEADLVLQQQQMQLQQQTLAMMAELMKTFKK